jgi:hypothetical protein
MASLNNPQKELVKPIWDGQTLLMYMIRKPSATASDQEVITDVLRQECKVCCDPTYRMGSLNQYVTALQLNYIYPHCEPFGYSLLLKLFLSDWGTR